MSDSNEKMLQERDALKEMETLWQQEITVLERKLAAEQRLRLEALEGEERLRREFDDAVKESAALQDKLSAAQTELRDVDEWAKELQIEVRDFVALRREFEKTKMDDLAAVRQRCDDAQRECVTAREETAALQTRIRESGERRDSLERQLAAAMEREGRLQKRIEDAQREMQALKCEFSGVLPESSSGSDFRGRLLDRNDIGAVFYELTQIPGVRVNLRFDAPEQVEVDEEQLPSRWLHGTWELSGIPLACVLDEQFRRAIGLPGVLIESGSVSSGAWSFKGNVYAVQQQ